jgi:multiple sugar transport system ATP-binding protein
MVEAVEPLGSETLVHLRLGNNLVIATAPGRVVPAIGSTVSVQAEPGSLYLFDAASEKALGRA